MLKMLVHVSKIGRRMKDSRNVFLIQMQMNHIFSLAWSDWGDWTSCTKTCDQALRVRKRKCEGFGLPCQGASNEKSECMDTSRHTLCPPGKKGTKYTQI